MSARTSLLRLVGVAALLATSGPACRAILGWDDFSFDGTGGGGTGGTGGTTTTNPDCIPNQTGGAIGDACGVFVSPSGKDTNPGTSTAKPVATLKHAIELAKGGRVYACADPAKAFVEAVEVTGDTVVFGGLDCGTWKYAAGTKTKWTAGADELPLRLADGASVTLADMLIEAADAEKEGGSSIAILAQAGASVDLSRCEVVAGNGKDGATPTAPEGTGTAGMPGIAGKDGCLTVDDLTGGKGGALTCSDGTDVSGGPGGNGIAASSGGAGSPGQPEDGTNGLGGSGQKEAPATACTSGGDGAEGVPGDPGLGATGNGSVSSSGYTGESGKDNGTAGEPGHGGGGGGGAKRCAMPMPPNNNAGPSAGGGGSGGCGGAPGKGGGAGGASIALVSLGATLTFNDVKLTAHDGGKGGDGGPGQPGGDGGVGGMPGSNGGDMTSMACSGGKGGKGGTGGRGGGGRGGPSIGVAYTGAKPITTGATITVGNPGKGGAGDGGAGAGKEGVSQPAQAF